MPVTTTSVALHITPVILKTFFTHGKRKAQRLKERNEEESPLDDILYDQAFHIVKSFIRMGTHNTVESLQGFTNTHVPSPYWAAVAPVLIPLSSCNEAADVLIEWFGPEELKQVVGGEKWWQVRGLDGLEAEWVTQRKYLDQPKKHANEGGQKLSDREETISRMDDLDSVMLYIHGGGYYWGSINTHRYQVLRHTRKFHGRAFTVNYRKAPQYPWPCAIQDVLAACKYPTDMYLTNPPEGALHKPIAHHKITLVGDSAGGGLCLALMTILRDLSRPLPVGAVLISPWVDLTYSFPSILENTATDIIPEYGFIHKPSTLWPIDIFPPEGGRISRTGSNPPPSPGGEAEPQRHSKASATGKDKHRLVQPLETQEGMLSQGHRSPPNVAGTPFESVQNSLPSTAPAAGPPLTPLPGSPQRTSVCELEPPKILLQDSGAVPLEFRSQIQLYATTEQLTHPLVSPAFQGSLGNLPPLYIIAGDGELLRDEIMYLAHRAAYPQVYPTREGILHYARRQRENAVKFTNGTKVHLQVFDGMCHVPTVFTFASNVKCAYRSIGEFIKHVTRHTTEELARNPFPDFPGQTPMSDPLKPCSEDTGLGNLKRNHHKKRTSKERVDEAMLETGRNQTEPCPNSSDARTSLTLLNDPNAEDLHPHEVQLHCHESSCVNAGQVSTPEAIQMIRERVNLHGQPRPMEPAEDIPALKLEAREHGILKEAPAMMWKKVQDDWDRRYKRTAVSALKKRCKLQAKAEQILQNAYDQGFIHPSQAATHDEVQPEGSTTTGDSTRQTPIGEIQKDRRWGPLDLDDETPPPSAIAKRRDTPEALALLKKHIYFTAPITHQSIPRTPYREPVCIPSPHHNESNRPPRQSVSEQQKRAHVFPVHKLCLWGKLVMQFGRKSAKAGNEGESVGDESRT
ncbi:alpha/beta-hydrolase [Macrolepiota fuliginosa MF-IS2]|uniref:Alpha/beta-hydrolase n=1 Tax=Macrolepiota fuliginosa MF-IS2 TaxID=1400762 RepID=A0A9P6C9C7_9AGAR|nr:alpha/beta-hydrolase [Macrolepiota fuliginosa MF-IS2]